MKRGDIAYKTNAFTAGFVILNRFGSNEGSRGQGSRVQVLVCSLLIGVLCSPLDPLDPKCSYSLECII